MEWRPKWCSNYDALRSGSAAGRCDAKRSTTLPARPLWIEGLGFILMATARQSAILVNLGLALRYERRIAWLGSCSMKYVKPVNNGGAEYWNGQELDSLRDLLVVRVEVRANDKGEYVARVRNRYGDQHDHSQSLDVHVLGRL